MAGSLPELAVSAVKDVAADSHDAKVLLNYVSKLLLCHPLPERRQLWCHVVLDAILYQCIVKLHISSFLLPSSLSFRLNLCLCALSDMHDAKIVV